MANIYLIADNHFGHDNIRKYSNRPFDSVGEMDEVMTERWNATVSKRDTVYHLGDFAWGNDPLVIERCRARLNGKICLIRGNHDYPILKAPERFAQTFEWVKDLHKLVVKDCPPVILCHYCMYGWEGSHFGWGHAHGHDHGTTEPYTPQYHLDRGLPFAPVSIDVGVDCHDFYPVSLEYVLDFLEMRRKGRDFRAELEERVRRSGGIIKDEEVI